MCLAIPGKILSISGDNNLERVSQISSNTIEKEASLALVPEAVIGNYVLIHAGIAISIVQEEEASRIFEYLEQIGEIEL